MNNVEVNATAPENSNITFFNTPKMENGEFFPHEKMK